MKIKDIFTDKEEYLEDTTVFTYPRELAISKLDENNLKQIASDLEINYILMNRQSNIDNKLQSLSTKTNAEEEKETYINTDIYYIFVIPLVGLLLWNFICYKRRL